MANGTKINNGYILKVFYKNIANYHSGSIILINIYCVTTEVFIYTT